MPQLIGNSSRGMLFILSAPAGTGKTTLVHMLQNEFPSIAVSISCTTRHPRETEIPDKDYHFLTRKEFEKKIKAGEFLEYAEVFGNYYGTLSKDIDLLQKQGRHVFLVIDTQGAVQLKGKIHAVFIFLSAPSPEHLRERLLMRRTETEQSIETRLSWAEKEMQMIPFYDYHVVNDDLHVAYQILRSIVIAEEHRVRNP